MLYKRGLINLSQLIIKDKLFDVERPFHLRDARKACTRVVLNNRYKICYDIHDSCEVDEEYMDWSDIYFKRSYSAELHKSVEGQKKKIYPLGLWHEIFPDFFDKFAIQRSITQLNTPKYMFLTIVRALNLFNSIKFTPRTNNMELLPDFNAAPKILFSIKAWDPFDNKERPQNKIDERISLNEFRANCIKLLKKEFGHNFFGGFDHSEFTKKNYKELLLPDRALYSKKQYINLLKNYPICVATAGLHRANGAKLAEYIAFSKAIISEKLYYQIPGKFEKDKNYLEFASPEECVEKAVFLYSNKEIRENIMINNSRFYQLFVKPDSLILNTILTVLSSY